MKKRGRSQTSSNDTTSLERMILTLKKDQVLSRFHQEAVQNEKRFKLMDIRDRLSSLFSLELKSLSKGSPLDGHLISKEYRTKMTDWMIEVCTSFRCAERTYFLAVALFDKFMRKVSGKIILQN